MQLMRWEPYRNYLVDEMGRFRGEVGNLFDRLGVSLPGLAVGYPPVNVWEDEENVYVEAELPGMKLEHLELFVREGNELTVKGERPAVEEKGTWHRRERGIGKFERVIELPFPVQPEKVVARFEQGVLHVTLPKSEAVKPRRIAVKAE